MKKQIQIWALVVEDETGEINDIEMLKGIDDQDEGSEEESDNSHITHGEASTYPAKCIRRAKLALFQYTPFEMNAE